MSSHFSLNRKASNCKIHNSIKKHGKHNFKIEVLACATNLNDLNYLESYFIKEYNSLAPNGYNLTTGGDNFKCSEETCKKMSKSRTGLPRYNRRGVKFSEARKEKLRMAKLGTKQTKEHIRNAILGRIGKKLKPIIAIHQTTNEIIYFSGIKFAVAYGFSKSNIHLSLKLNKPYKNYKFQYKEISNA